MTKTTARKGTWPIVVATVISWIVLIYAMSMSSSHIITAAFKIGLVGIAAYTAPLLVDAVAVVGKLGRLERFTEACRRSSLKLLLFGGLMSLVANVYAGENLGQQIHGVLVVVVALWIESHITKLKLKAVDEPAEETKTEPVVEPAPDTVAELESPVLQEAPVSPAPAGPRPYSERHDRRLRRGK